MIFLPKMFRFLLIFLLLGSFSLLAVEAYAVDSPVYVMVRESKLRAKSDFFSASVGDIKYGDRLDVVKEQGSWLQVRTSGGKQGFVHTSSITERRVVLKSGAKFEPSGTDQSDVVLAGKGFSADVERQFASSHRNLNFADVDAMERIKVSPKELVAFAEQGKLGSQGAK